MNDIVRIRVLPSNCGQKCLNFQATKNGPGGATNTVTLGLTAKTESSG